MMNNYMPMYQNPMYANPQNNFMPKPIINNGINWVQGIEGAKAYQIQPNSNVVLLDSERNKMYIKTSDNIGMCNLRIFDFTEVTEMSAQDNTVINHDLSNYVTRDELNSILEKLIGGPDNEQSLQSTKSKKSTIAE